jgi:DinB family protein
MMHQHLADVFATLDASRQALRESVAAIPAASRHDRPAPDRWSPVDIVHHLALVETRFSAVVGGKIAEALSEGLGPETRTREALPERVRMLLANRTEKRTAPEVAIPTGHLDEAAAWAAADAARAGFRTAVLSANGRALSSVIHEHPFFGALNVYQWVELIAAHEMRHVAQVRETAAQLMARA